MLRQAGDGTCRPGTNRDTELGCVSPDRATGERGPVFGRGWHRTGMFGGQTHDGFKGSPSAKRSRVAPCAH